MRPATFALLSIALAVPALVAAAPDDQKAKTADGKEVILKDDGTWAYAPKPEKPKPDDAKEGEVAAYTKPDGAKLAHTGKRGTFELHLVPDTWEESEGTRGKAGEAGFHCEESEIYGMVIAERAVTTPEALKNAGFANARKIDKKAKILAEDVRVVNGTRLVCATFTATVSEISITYMGYYASGPQGSVQLLTWTASNLFDENKPKMEQFLNGLVFLKKKPQ